MSVKRWDGYRWVTQSGSRSAYTYQASAPANPSVGDIWVDSNSDITDTLDFVTLIGTETLYSKTLVSPTVTGTLTSANILNGTFGSNVGFTPLSFNTGTELSTGQFVFKKSVESAFGANVAAGKSRGTAAVPTAVTNGDQVGIFSYWGHDGTSYLQGAYMLGSIDGTVSTNTVPTAIIFATTQTTGPVERMRIGSDGTVTVAGNLIVGGTTTTINSSTLAVDDKNIELGAVSALSNISGTISSTATTTTMTGTNTAGMIPGMTLTKVSGTGIFGTSPTITSIDSATQFTFTTTTANTAGAIVFSVGGITDLTASGGGITLKGATDKTIIWDSTNSNWTSSENWNIASGKLFKVNNTEVLSATKVLGITPTTNATGFTLSGGTTAVAVSFAGGAAYTLSGTNAQTYTFPTTGGTLPLNNQTFYIGTQAIAINAGTGTITSLPGVTSINGATLPSSGTIPNTGQTFYIGSTAITIAQATGTITALAGVTSVNGTTIPATATLLTSTSTTSALTSFGSSATLTTPTIDVINAASATGITASLYANITSGTAAIGALIGSTAAVGTLNIATNAGIAGGTKAINLGTGATAGTTTITIGSATGTTTTLNGTVNIASTFQLAGTGVTTTAARLNYLTSAGGTTGTTSTNIVFSTSPTLTTPVLTGPTFASNSYTTTQTLTTSNDIVFITAGAAWTLTLPAATTAGKILHIIRTDATAFAISVAGTLAAGWTSPVATWFPASTANRRLTLISNGTAWYPMYSGAVV